MRTIRLLEISLVHGIQKQDEPSVPSAVVLPILLRLKPPPILVKLGIW